MRSKDRDRDTAPLFWGRLENDMLLAVYVDAVNVLGIPSASEEVILCKPGSDKG